MSLRDGSDYPLSNPIDGKGMVVSAVEIWVATEGRRAAKHQAQLLRFDAASGQLTLSLPLTAAWQPTPSRVGLSWGSVGFRIPGPACQAATSRPAPKARQCPMVAPASYWSRVTTSTRLKTTTKPRSHHSALASI